ncbi:MAG: multidrug resistance efflux transporter family protein [Acetobacteraceae bacterium]
MPAATRRPGLPGLVGLGLLAAALFSSTFVLNRSVSLAGGPWVWSAALRYVDMAVLLIGWIGLAARRGPAAGGVAAVLVSDGVLAGRGRHRVRRVLRLHLLRGRPRAWVDRRRDVAVHDFGHADRIMGVREPRAARGVLFAVVIVLGIGVLNAHAFAGGAGARLAAILPVLVAAFAYPLGNQLLNRARHGLQDPDGVLRTRRPACC